MMKKRIGALIVLLFVSVVSAPAGAKPAKATLIAVGDIMMHDSQRNSGYDKKTKTYSFDTFFADVADILSQGDWVVANLETPVAGKDLKYAGFPQFNAPVELLDAVRGAGFEVLTLANNHVLDRRLKGIERTIENVRSRGMFPIGVFATEEDSKDILFVTKKGIKMAFLAYTYGTNGIFPPKGSEYAVAMLDEAKMVSDIERARQEGADVVTICLHFGTEYQRRPAGDQIDLARNLIAAGADIILGSHSHVVQPYEFVTVDLDGKPQRRGVVIYSMGNFISGQAGSHKDLGVIFKVDIRKKMEKNETDLTGVTVIPTYVDQFVSDGRKKFRVVSIEKVLDSRDDPRFTDADYKQFLQKLKEIKKHAASKLQEPKTSQK